MKTDVEITCTCGQRFVVADDGSGAPHACPRCSVANVLPRRAGGVMGALLGATAVRSTRVLSDVLVARSVAKEGVPSGTFLGPYEVLRRIGKGGMGSVYEAREPGSGRKVALKVLSPELAQNPDFVARFQREARALEGVHDARLARVFFAGAAEGLPFFAMEYVDGQNLEQVLLASGPLKAERAVPLMRETALGLKAAAERGIIHRDVKPTNLLLDRDGRLRIVDFGLAKAIDSDSRLTVTGAVVGTPYYLSPEQGLGKSVDERSDIYSLGATFYHLLSGKPPFDAESPVSIILRHVNDPPPPLKAVRAAIPEPLARIVMRCLAKDPGRRYQDWDELVEDLDAVARGEPVAAPPEHTWSARKNASVVVVDDLDESTSVLRRAALVRRALALAMDLGVAFAVALFLSIGVARLLPDPPSVRVLFVLGGLLYLGLGDGLGGHTVGKRFFRLRVARPDGTAPGIVRGVARAVALAPVLLAVPGLVKARALQYSDLAGSFGLRLSPSELKNWAFAIAGIAAADLLASLVTRRGETLHDLVSGTSVFKLERVKKRKPKRSPLQHGDEPVQPILPLLASVIPGGGQFVNGEPGKAVLFLVLTLSTIAAFGLGLIAWIYAGYDAFATAERRQRQWAEQKTSAS